MEGRLSALPWRRLLLAALLTLLTFLSWSRLSERGVPASDSLSQTRSAIGFTSARHLDEHYEKHGSEFGKISKQDYLARAQALRDATVGGAVLEAVRKDGVTTRFDRATGAFVAFNPDQIGRAHV